MSLAGFSLRRPYTIFAVIALMCLLAGGAAQRMPTDIFPEINIPVVSVVWTYNGMSATDIQNRILALHERQLASLVDDISRIEANSYVGVGVIKVYLQEGADVSRAISQLGSSALVVLKYMPRNITPPLILRYGATDVPIIQLSLSSNTVTDTALNDLGQNIIRPALAVVRGASVPYPSGGIIHRSAPTVRTALPQPCPEIALKTQQHMRLTDASAHKRDYRPRKEYMQRR